MPTPLPRATFRLLPAGLRDISAVRDLEQLSFPLDAWPLIEMIGVLSLPNVLRWKAVEGEREELVGFIAVDVRRRQNIAWIATVAVHPERRGQGIGDALMAAAETGVDVPRMRLSTRMSNEVAIALYEKRGYQRVDVWPRYYAGGEDALVMEKWLYHE
ncbi:MAG: GNAT family N-acetyltransferase [Anaerolineales bacterium]|nr:GNAT family N-acetyltransferase [Anaerolineales bacterium]